MIERWDYKLPVFLSSLLSRKKSGATQDGAEQFVYIHKLASHAAADTARKTITGENNRMPEQTTATRNPATFTAHLDGNAEHQPGIVPGSLNSGLCPVAVLLGWEKPAKAISRQSAILR